MSNLLKLLIILLFCIPLKSFSMEKNDIRFNKLKSYDHSSPSSITKDKFGFLWIGTSEGLFKFDGYKYIEYKNNINDERSISSETIRAILLDSEGR